MKLTKKQQEELEFLKQFCDREPNEEEIETFEKHNTEGRIEHSRMSQNPLIQAKRKK